MSDTNENDHFPQLTSDSTPGTGADASISKEHGLAYWESISADENGMLGGIPSVAGFANTSKIDLQGSRNFLAKFGIGSKSKPGLKHCQRILEGGAGVGRITEGLLTELLDEEKDGKVDVVEPIAKFTAKLQGKRGVGKVYVMGLEEWVPEFKYDLVWTQWCVGHLTDEQLAEYLKRCKSALTEDGLIVIKENTTVLGNDEFDAEDSSVTRGEETFQKIFQKAGLKIVRAEFQKGFPQTRTMKLLPVRMYALKP
ncbi:alpha-N-methyltransferase NTM1 [Pseudoneurospora amorphoporcata]|uniref:Alpha N-terminal protein methyltransferase 1 n=1 Tax=Pseudoneurospora amorphoporcata TaxID=241081 RepID=A0AAN6NVD3_9PEZI|nr:alpha-N-methyltransferase NTM1 [Pseudoneurospora amorphoporcata]